jgi:hypothetical protein
MHDSMNVAGGSKRGPLRSFISAMCYGSVALALIIGLVVVPGVVVASAQTVTSISPSSGPTAGGTSVTITGSGFTGATSVSFGTTTAASFSVVSDTQVTATSPSGSGTVDVTVTTPSGTSATGAFDQFNYLAPSTPTITGVSQIIAQNNSTIHETSGPAVVITGSGFGPTPPVVTQSPTLTGAPLGSSALGVDANTSNLQLEDTTGTFTGSYMGLYPNSQSFGDCYVTIGSWSDTQIIVTLDDTGLASCSNIVSGDTFNVTVWSTNGGAMSNQFVTAAAQAPGTTAAITQLSPASGPVTGGTFSTSGATNPSGTITVTGSNLAGTSIVWFGNGGSDGGIATTNFTLSPDNSSLTVTPPPAPANSAEGLFVVITTPAGTSDVQCLAIDSGCQGTYYYQSQSIAFPAINSGPVNPDFNGALSVNLAVPQSAGACPGSAPSGGTGLSFTASAVITGGPISLSGPVETSTNDGVLSSVQAPITVNVQSPVTIAISLQGAIAGCYAIPIPGLNVAGLGGLYVIIGGSIAVAYTMTVTLNQGTWVVDSGYVPNQLSGAMIPAGSQNCTNGTGAAAPCIQTNSAASISGTLDFSPLWFGLDISAGGVFSLAAGAGLTVSAFVTASTSTGFDYDICFGGTYAASITAAGVTFAVQGTFFGPFNIYGDGTVCPLGSIGTGLPSTSVSVTSSANPSSAGQQVIYTATVSPTDNNGTVSFSDNGSAIASCETAPLNSLGQATCDQTYSIAGAHNIVANYSGDTAYAGSVSGALAQQVNGSASGPIVTGVSPSSGDVAGGTSATISGTGFSGATGVSFGTVAATSFGVVSDTDVTAVAPPGTSSVDVTVTTPVATSATGSVDLFTYTTTTPSPNPCHHHHHTEPDRHRRQPVLG